MDRKDALTLAEAADALSCSRSTLHRRIKAGLIASEKVGPAQSDRVYVPRSAIDAYFAAHLISPRKED